MKVEAEISLLDSPKAIRKYRAHDTAAAETFFRRMRNAGAMPLGCCEVANSNRLEYAFHPQSPSTQHRGVSVAQSRRAEETCCRRKQKVEPCARIHWCAQTTSFQ